MSYFDPKIYNKQNLKEEDRKELDFWCAEFLSLIDNAEADIELGSLSIEKEVIHKFCKELKLRLGYSMQDVVVGIIDDYEEEYDVEEVDDPDTYLYDDEEDEDNE